MKIKRYLKKKSMKKALTFVFKYVAPTDSFIFGVFLKKLNH